MDLKKALLFFSILYLAASCSPKNKSYEDEQKEDIIPPEIVAKVFAEKDPETVVTWVKEGNNFEANFEYQENEMSAIYDANGSLIETEVEIEVNALPKAILDYMKKNYQEAIEEAAKVTKPNGEVFYEAELKGTDIVFNADGNFLKAERE